MTFVNLHHHDSYSMLDGLGFPSEAASYAAELGMSALAQTNHGNMFGAFAHFKACRAAGIKPILGMEMYLSPGAMDDHTPHVWGEISEGDKLKRVPTFGAYSHLTVLAQDATGLRNLYLLHELSYAQGHYYKPRVDFETLAAHGKGLIILSGCVGGELAQRLRLGQPDEALALASAYAEAFPGRYYVEIMAHGLDFEAELNPQLASLAAKLKLPLVATGDSHYVHPDDGDIHECLLAVSTQTTLDDPKRMTFHPGEGYSLLSELDMEALFEDYPGAVLNSGYIASTITEDAYDEVFAWQNLMPFGEIDDLRLMAETGLIRKDLDWTGAWDQLDYELQIIGDLGYAGYFLALADIVGWARRQGIFVGAGRGSGVASLVAHAVGITGVNPMDYGLVFERFLNPERLSAPDIDLDFESARRDEVVEYAIARFGEAFTCRILTLGTIATRRAILDSAKVLGLPASDAKHISSLVPPPRRGRTLALQDVEGLQERYPEVYRVAAGLDGQLRQPGIHAGGLIISSRPLREVIPMKRAPSDPGWISGYTMKEVEDLGLCKNDLLGVTTLDVIKQTIRYVHTIHQPFRLEDIPLEDPEAFRMLREGRNLGVFQLGEPWVRGILKDVQPDSFSDIVALLALIRPGSFDQGGHKLYADRKRSGQTMPSVHPEINEALEPVLRETYGIIVYQEDVLQVIKFMTGWGYGQADLVFNAFRKKDLSKLAKAKPDFFSASKFSVSATQAVWDVLVAFGDYGFGKGHSVAYAYTTSWTSYLKAHYPAQFIASLLTHVDGKNAAEKLRKLLALIKEAKNEGIPILAPDVNESAEGWTPTEEGIRYGLASIRDVGEKVVRRILDQRPYSDIDDLYRRADPAVLSSKVLGALLRSGSLDGLWNDREGVLEESERVSKLALDHRKKGEQGERTLFPLCYNPAIRTRPVVDWPARNRAEAEYLGVSVSQPTIVLNLSRELTETELAWTKQILGNRPPVCKVLLAFPFGPEFNGFREIIEVKSSPERLSNTLAKLGIEVTLE